MAVMLEVVTEELSRRLERVHPRFVDDPRFKREWWHRGSAKSPVSFCRFLDDGEEVARAKILPGAGVYAGYTTWSCPAGGVTEIDLIEVRPDLRRSRKQLGRQAVDAIGRHYGHPVVAMSLDEESDLFWASIGWNAHTHPDGGRYRVLFTSV